MLIVQELRRRSDKGALDRYYQDDGPFRRELYPVHVEILNAGAEHAERAVLGGNRVGKTESIGGYETALHLTGLYPHWWEGKRFDRPILAWACGVKSAKVRDVNQLKLIGNLRRADGRTIADGGLIPAPHILRLTRKTGVANAIDQAFIRHRLGHENVLTFKGYEEGPMAFASEAVHWIWLDEEPPEEVYDECIMRLLTTQGSIMSTLTPVEGMTGTVMKLLEGTDLL